MLRRGMSEEAPVFETTTGPVRVITAASLFDGHDAAINVMRRLIQSSGAEVIHLGHDRSAKDVVDCAVQELSLIHISEPTRPY